MNERGLRDFFAAYQFLQRESYLLDDRNVVEWFDMIHEDVDYRVPVRRTRERESRSDYSSEAFHMREDYSSLEARVDRLENEYDWSEDPPSRTRRFVSNLAVSREAEDELSVNSYLLLFRSQGDTASYDLISGRREDRLRATGDGRKLVDRRVLLDHTVLGLSSSQSLSVFL